MLILPQSTLRPQSFKNNSAFSALSAVEGCLDSLYRVSLTAEHAEAAESQKPLGVLRALGGDNLAIVWARILAYNEGI